MLRLVLSRAAERDIENILAWSHEHFGERARIRYEALIVRALLDVWIKPDRVGSQLRPEIAEGIRTYHLFHSRRRVDRKSGKVGRPRHFLLYRVRSGELQVGRVLHDSMDLDRQLPGEFSTPPSTEQ